MSENNSPDRARDDQVSPPAIEQSNFVVISNAFGTSQVAPAPKHPDGTPYQFEMITDEGKYRVYADTPTALCEYLIPNYAELRDQGADSVDKAAQRILYAVSCQVKLQSYLMLDYEDRGEYPTQEEQAVLEAPRDVPPQVTLWESEVPLVLVTSYYQPYGELPVPIGRPLGMVEAEGANLVWLDPVGEMPLLLSLHRAGLLILSQRKPPPVVSPASPIDSDSGGGQDSDTNDTKNKDSISIESPE